MRKKFKPIYSRIIYTGAPCHLGRFGLVNPGDELMVDQRELAHIQAGGSVDFAPHADDAQPPKDAPPLPLLGFRGLAPEAPEDEKAPEPPEGESEKEPEPPEPPAAPADEQAPNAKPRTRNR